jgi:hypothetical protein
MKEILPDLTNTNAKVLWEHGGEHELTECERQLTEKWDRVETQLAEVVTMVKARHICKNKINYISLLMELIKGHEEDKRKLLGIQKLIKKTEEE